MAKYKSTHTGQQIDEAVSAVANKADTTYVNTELAKKANTATTLAGYGITDAKIASGVITLGSNTIIPITTHQDISSKADKATTLSGYGITDANITNGVITLGSNTITPITSHQDISGKADKASISAGTYKSVSVNSSGIVTGGSNPTTLSGYGITDAKISSGVITLGSNTITPITSHQDISGKADKSYITAGTAGTSSSTSGSTLSVPYLTMNSSGIVTGYGTHTHTVTGFSTTDTKNTAGTTNTTSKIYLAGATSQGDNPQTYSNSSCYASGGYLYSGGTKVSVEGHTHTYLPLSGGTLTGVTVAQNNTSYTTKQVRNIFISTSSPSGGSNGDIWIKYTA